MRISKIALTAILAATVSLGAMAQHSLEKATHEEVLKASLSAMEGNTNKYTPVVTETSDASTGETVRTFKIVGPADDANAVFAQCHILMQENVGIDREGGIIRQVDDSTPICGAQYKSMREVITIAQVEASFSVREYSF